MSFAGFLSRKSRSGAILGLIGVEIFLAGCMQESAVSPEKLESMELSYRTALSAPTRHVVLTAQTMPGPPFVPSFTMDQNNTALDWVVFRGGNPVQEIRKAGVTPKIICGSTCNSQAQYTTPLGQPTIWKWTNGTPYTSGETKMGIKDYKVLEVTAESQPKTLTVFISVYRARAKVQVALPGLPFSERIFENMTGLSTFMVEVRFRDLSPKTMSFALIPMQYYSGGVIFTHAARLHNYQNTAPFVQLKAPPVPEYWDRYLSNLKLPLELDAIPSDPDGIAGVRWFRGNTSLGEVTSPPYSLPDYVETLPGINEYRAEVMDKFGAVRSTTPKYWDIWEWDPVMLNGTYPYGTIPDNNSTGITFEYPQPVSRQLARINVRFSVSHTYLSDLIVKLTAPNGVSALMANRVGYDGDNFNKTVFSDQAALSIQDPSATPPYSGSYRPTQPLSVFNEMNPQGTWKLNFADVASADIGNVSQPLIFFLYRTQN